MIYLRLGWICCFLCFITVIFGQTDASSLKGKNIIHFTVDQSIFLDTELHPYMEAWVSVDATTLAFKKNDKNSFQAGALVKLKLNGKTNTANDLELEQKLLTPIIQDTAAGRSSFFIMHAFRFDVIPDSVKLVVEVKDINVPNSSTTGIEKELWIAPNPKDAFLFGEVIFLDQFKKTTTPNAFSRLGYDIVPLVSNSYYDNKDTLRAYFELYNLTQLAQGKYRLRAFISEPELTRPIAQFEQVNPLKPITKFDINLIQFDIRSLAGNSYTLHIEILDESKKVIAKTQKVFYVTNLNQTAGYLNSKENEIYFERLYALKEKDLDAIIPKLNYISTQAELDFAKSLTDFEMKKNYFVNFWRKRMTNPAQPTKEWEDYLRRIRYANERFRSSFREGWKTDRGRVLLTYGAPSDMQAFPVEHDKVPYEIWTYNRIKAQTGVVFVFADNDLATNECPLIHSTLVGETYNSNWRNNIMKRRERDFNLSPEQHQPDEFKETLPRTLGSPR